MFHENKVQTGARNTRARFFTDNGQDMVCITFVDSKDEHVRPVRMYAMDSARPADPDAYPLEWAAFNNNRPKEVLDGTPLEAIPGLAKDTYTQIRMHGFKTCEKLAELDDGQADKMGAFGIAWRDLARLVLKAKGAEKSADEAKPRKAAA